MSEWEALLVTDCDGCLTDGNVYYLDNGQRARKFSVRDGMGFSMLKESGIFPIVLSGEYDKHMRHRFDKLEIPFFQSANKLEFVNSYRFTMNMEGIRLIVFGDDLNDMELMREADFIGCPHDGVRKIKQLVFNRSGYICKKAGGNHSFREFCEEILGLYR